MDGVYSSKKETLI